jgi:hypothetical protein
MVWCFFFHLFPFLFFFFWVLFLFLQNSLLVPPTDQHLLTGWSATVHKVLAYLHVDSCHFTWSPRLVGFPPDFSALGWDVIISIMDIISKSRVHVPLKFLSDSVPARRTRLVNGCQASLKSAFGQ